MYYTLTTDYGATIPHGDAIAWSKEYSNSPGQNTRIFVFVSAQLQTL